MLEKVLVPLDGSELSDRIVSVLRRLLHRRDAAVSLVEVVAPRLLEAEKVPGQLLEGARRHLEAVAAPLREGGARVTAKALVGDAAERILDESLEDPPALIVMATHGRSGVQRWTRGSVAERVLRGAKAPLLLANPFGLDAAKETRFRRILVPLDGSPESASILPLVRELARLYEATAVLHFATPVSMPVEGVPAVFVTEADGKALLTNFLPRLEGVPVELTVGNGDPASSILDAAGRAKCDLVAMTTHGRSGLSRWILGSVAEHVLRHAPCPVLVARAAAP